MLVHTEPDLLKQSLTCVRVCNRRRQHAVGRGQKRSVFPLLKLDLHTRVSWCVWARSQWQTPPGRVLPQLCGAEDLHRPSANLPPLRVYTISYKSWLAGCVCSLWKKFKPILTAPTGLKSLSCTQGLPTNLALIKLYLQCIALQIIHEWKTFKTADSLQSSEIHPEKQQKTDWCRLFGRAADQSFFSFHARLKSYKLTHDAVYIFISVYTQTPCSCSSSSSSVHLGR